MKIRTKQEIKEFEMQAPMTLLDVAKECQS